MQTDFAIYLLTQPSFVWQILSQSVTVRAIGIVVEDISLQKMVVLAGSNSLRDGVVINSFDLPANHPAGGVALTLQTTVTNRGAIGVALSSLGFQAFYDRTNIAPVAAAGAYTLPAAGSNQLPLAGRLVPQPEQSGLDDVSAIFNGFIHGQPVLLQVAGDYAGRALAEQLRLTSQRPT